MSVYDCCQFFNENDIFEIRLNQHWDFVDKFIVVEAGETHTGLKKPLNFDHKRFEKYKSKIEYRSFDSFAETMQKFPAYNCTLGRQIHGNHDDWSRDHFQANYTVKVLEEIGARDSDIVYLASADEMIKQSAFEESLRRFQNPNEIFVGYDTQSGRQIVGGLRPVFGFHMFMYVYKLNLLRFTDIVAGMITEFSNFKKIMPATIRSLSLTTHSHIKDGGWHLSYMDNGDGEMVLAKHHSWAHARDPGGIDGKRRFDTANKYESVQLLNREHPATMVPILAETHPKYIVDNLDKFSNYILHG
jgi:beta-1,4-mannosyl-glycoprotein beta-1,4-N-acetylglucosaminyltransferase